ncbi:cobalamin B12-binding domain-containing protein [Zhaonella formicivorans]|uniref:cobalamin B12-binding domain-containing protein n=1 Tax=Zhaonella formicivorans TaxID=2528593 RepID=UPI001D0F9436|nr:cobalamin-dependent protein [Zhaonella formicivorans]
MTQELTDAIVALDEEKVRKIAKSLIEAGESPEVVIENIRLGLQVIGDKFDKGETFIAELIMAGEIVSSTIEQIKPYLLENQSQVSRIGKAVIGTVQGDVHDIGLNIVATFLDLAGFEVYNLGIDVSPATFAEKVRETRPQLLGLSGLITASQGAMAETVEAVKAAGLREGLKIMIGGAIVNEGWIEKVGADVYCKDAAQAARVAKQLVERMVS